MVRWTAVFVCALLLALPGSALADRPPFYRVLDSWGQQDLAAAERFMEQVDPNSPARIAAEGVVHAMKGEFVLAQAKLQKVQQEVGDYLIINEIHALCCAMNGKFARAREVLGPDDDGVRPLRMAVEGPFRAKYPLAAPLLETVTESGRYRIVSDVGLPMPIDQLEAKLAATVDPAARKAFQAKIRRKHVALDQLGEIMDKAFQNFERMFGELRHVEGVSTVYVFADRERFDEFRAAFNLQGEHVMGTYFPIARTLVFYERGGEEDLAASAGLCIGRLTLKTLLHESFHQYLHLCVDKAPPWINEGLAEFFGLRLSDQIIRQRKPGPPFYPDRLRDVVFLREKANGLAPVLSLPKLMAQDQRTFMSTPPRAFTNYAQSWIFVHYLASTAAGRGYLLGYLRGLSEGDSVMHLNGKLLGLKEQRAKLEKGWRRHAGKLHKHHLEQDPKMVEWFEERLEKIRAQKRQGG